MWSEKWPILPAVEELIYEISMFSISACWLSSCTTDRAGERVYSSEVGSAPTRIDASLTDLETRQKTGLLTPLYFIRLRTLYVGLLRVKPFLHSLIVPIPLWNASSSFLFTFTELHRIVITGDNSDICKTINKNKWGRKIYQRILRKHWCKRYW